jgi:predicted dehydrogenase
MRFFVVGCGSIGRRHVRNLKVLGFDDIFVFDEDPRAADSCIQETGAKRVRSLAEGIEQSPDAALICTPNHLHISTALEVAAKGIHLFIEKPLDDSLENLPSLVQLVHEHRLTNLVSCNFRFDQGLALFKQLMEKGAIGKVYSLRAYFGYYLPDWRKGSDYRRNYAARRSTGGGVILDRIHELDYVTWMLGDVIAFRGVARKLSNLEIETEDLAEIVLDHISGVVSTIHLDYLRREYLCTCEATGSDGILSWSFKDRSLRRYDVSSGKWSELSNDIPKDPNSMYIEELKYFVHCIRNRIVTQNTVADAARTLELALHIRQGVLAP